MKIFVVDEKNAATGGFANRPPRMSDRLERTRGNPIRQRTMARRSGGSGGGGPIGGGGRRGGGRGGGGGARAPRKEPIKLSGEDLDRELDAYMGSGRHKRISID